MPRKSELEHTVELVRAARIATSDPDRYAALCEASHELTRAAVKGTRTAKRKAIDAALATVESGQEGDQ